MIVSRIARSSSRAARSTLHRGSNYGVRKSCYNECVSRSSFPVPEDSCESRALGIVRRYVSSAGAGKQNVHRSCIIENLRARRLFSSEAPKKRNYEKYYPKEKKEIPKANEQKKESLGTS